MINMFDPADSTLRRYGMTRGDWLRILYKQGHTCAICGRQPENGKLVIDHEHVKGWKKMKPADRRKYVRMLACNRCNWQFLRRGMTAQIAYGMYQALSEYELAKTGVDSQASPV